MRHSTAHTPEPDAPNDGWILVLIVILALIGMTILFAGGWPPP